MHVGSGDGELTEHVNHPHPLPTPDPPCIHEASQPSVLLAEASSSFKYDFVFRCIFTPEVQGGGGVGLSPPNV